MNILIVDDEVLIRQWFHFCLEKYKLAFDHIGEASNGQEALDMLDEFKPDIIITDIKMPVMDGIQLLHEVKSVRPSTEVILLTSHAEFLYAKQAVKFGAADYLLKAEIKETELIETLQRVMKNAATVNDSTGRAHGNSESKYGTTIARAIAYIEQHYAESLSLKEVSRHVHLNANYFSQTFKQKTGTNFNDFLTQLRLAQSKDYLQHSDMKAYEIAEKVGYPNFSYFSRVFKKYCGKSPQEFRAETR